MHSPKFLYQCSKDNPGKSETDPESPIASSSSSLDRYVYGLPSDCCSICSDKDKEWLDLEDYCHVVSELRLDVMDEVLLTSRTLNKDLK